MIIDSHCHLDFSPLGDHIDQVVSRASDAGVSHMLCVAVDFEAIPSMVKKTEPFDQISTSVGIHPNSSLQSPDPSMEQLHQLTQQKGVVAIGETGLDYFRSSGQLDWQRDRFRRHIELAKETKLPLIIHSRDAQDDTIALMKSEKAEEIGGVMHCFTGDWEFAKKSLDMGFYISFSGIVTFSSAKNIQEVATKVPHDRFMVETDAPYLTPAPYRGKTNEPAYVTHVAQFISTLRNCSYQQVCEETSSNFFNLFTAAAD